MGNEVQYTNSSGAYVAYQVIGEGSRDLLVVMEGFISVDMMDDEPRLARCMARLGSFARLIRFDRRGIGLSDPVSPSTPPTLEQWVEDAIAVLDAVESERAIVLASAEASSVGLLLAATHPDRVQSVVVVNGFARALVDVDYPEGMPLETLAQDLDRTVASPGDENNDFLLEVAPSVANDAEFRQWWEEAGRRGASPGTARALLRAAQGSDVRAVLPAIRIPTLVLHLRDDPLIPIRAGRYIADHVPGAQWVEVPGADDYWWASDSAGVVLAEVEEFVTGVVGTPPQNRVLSTILFTDIVSSTAARPSSAIIDGATCWTATTRPCVDNSRAFGVRRSTQPAMAFSRPSTVRHAPSNVHARSETLPDNSESKCVAACIPANLSSEETTSRVSPCTSPLESRLLPSRRPCGCRVP